MSYATVVEGMHERFATIEALSNQPILDYEPTSVQTTPMLYSLLDRAERSQAGQVTSMRYRILHRLLIAMVDFEQAEQLIIPFVNAIPAAVDADPQLDGRIGMGLAQISEVVAVYVKIAGVTYRALDIYSNVLEKGPYRGGEI